MAYVDEAWAAENSSGGGPAAFTVGGGEAAGYARIDAAHCLPFWVQFRF